MILFLASYQPVGTYLAAIPLQDFHIPYEYEGVRMTLEALIAAGVFGWLVIGMVLMGLGIW
jgi:hypothetical protein